ncbi:MAG: hypothetical protein WDA27_01210 [Actinomycetota bacterium]
MTKRILIAMMAFTELFVACYGGYALWTRATEPSFAQGGAFGVVDAAVTPTSSAIASRAPGATPGSSGSSAPRASASASPARTATPTRSPVAGGMSKPRSGLYLFDGSGSEQVQIGGASPCGWDISDVKITYNNRPEGVVKDVDVGEQRQERVISQYRADGIYTSYLGGAVTCLGVRKTMESTYDPPAMRVRLPLRVGMKWKNEAHTSGRDEHLSGEVRRKTRLSVPAGTFDTYEVRLEAQVSGDQSGHQIVTMFIVPNLGIAVKQIENTDFREGNTHFTSKISIELAAMP